MRYDTPPAADLADELARLMPDTEPLRETGVLLIGSGYMTHGLPYLNWRNLLHHRVPGWSADFDAWAADTLTRGDLDELAAFRDHAPGMPYAHPTVEHFTPLFVTLGAATDPTAAPVTWDSPKIIVRRWECSLPETFDPIAAERIQPDRSAGSMRKAAGVPARRRGKRAPRPSHPKSPADGTAPDRGERHAVARVPSSARAPCQHRPPAFRAGGAATQPAR